MIYLAISVGDSSLIRLTSDSFGMTVFMGGRVRRERALPALFSPPQ